ncbi:MAG: hypothetical protein ACO1G7_08240 [Bacteroidota bacterium]|jgi:transcriptional antiterminator Rof (Rho-off)|uniref:hypothetical protein n=1 Tax=Candidatus Pollutiaquabacter sp. TaxID=3416354 RepID=UPI001A376F7D|nr:hypothetical protein [Bacteroidota bacterium]MBL7948162.1 hypothetical protein [Bacteroidia bacterium]MBP6009265.1 hypothetical protein [Bacteroidia bacterium]MBP7269829.1 hypothetical protein [Bacteroidia bacterium]MBP7436810.1 hypothetical protein [Bacteroidia bacterium]
MQRPYQPIDCSLLDELEWLAMRRQPVLLSYRDEQDEEIHGVALIQDWYASQGIEYLVLGDGSVIRMDQLMSLNGKPVDACPSPSN